MSADIPRSGQAGEHYSPEQLVDAIRSVFGRHQARAVHAKGVLLDGAFKPTPDARMICKAPLFAGAIEHLVLRFSDSTGIPDIADTDPNANPRGCAIKFHLPGGTDTDIVTHSFNGFPVATADGLGALMSAVAASGPDAAKPTALDKFLESHPRAANSR